MREKNNKTPYELWHGKPTTVKYFIIFGSPCFIKKDDDYLGKFDPRLDEGIFLGYSSKSKAYRYFNKILHKIATSVNVKVHEFCNSCGENGNGENSAKKEEIEGAAQPSSSHSQNGTTSGNVYNNSKNVQSEVTYSFSDLEFGTTDIHFENEPESSHDKTIFKTPKFVQINHCVDQILPENRTRACWFLIIP